MSAQGTRGLGTRGRKGLELGLQHLRIYLMWIQARRRSYLLQRLGLVVVRLGMTHIPSHAMNFRQGCRAQHRIWGPRAELFRGVTRVAPSVAEYWMEATERIIDDLDFIIEQKLKRAISLLHDEAY
ncbi:esterase-like [Gossypium australe]|uniref:Esterase-like n=1 Tax=Gossypium australe TaxID=47621 RepID=A0A5B6WK25_9ROSI|nr:esterase-like [Gossypium australe]